MLKLRKLIYGIIIIFLVYIFMTDKGSVRFSILLSGYPKEAILGHLKQDKAHELKKNQKAYIIKPYPIEKGTDGVLDRWVATRYIVFYIAEFETGI